MENFTPLTSTLGGVLIGLSAAILILLNGRIAGISGILGNILTAEKDEKSWRILFLLGLILSPIVFSPLLPLPPIKMDVGILQIAIAGLLVGFGSRMGSGCTSGHGVCGISRLSKRSIIATACFMTAGIITVYFVH